MHCYYNIQKLSAHVTKKSKRSLPPITALVVFPKLSSLPESLGFVAINILAEVNPSVLSIIIQV